MNFVHDDPRIMRWLRLKIPYFEPGEGSRSIGVVYNGNLVAAIAYSNFIPPGEHWSGDCELSFAADHLRWFPEGGPKLLGAPFVQFGVGRVSARIAKKNRRARRLAEHLGFKREGVMRRALNRPGGAGDIVIYGMTRGEWEEARYGNGG